MSSLAHHRANGLGEEYDGNSITKTCNQDRKQERRDVGDSHDKGGNVEGITHNASLSVYGRNIDK